MSRCRGARQALQVTCWQGSLVGPWDSPENRRACIHLVEARRKEPPVYDKIHRDTGADRRAVSHSISSAVLAPGEPRADEDDEKIGLRSQCCARPDHSRFSVNRHGRFRESDVFRHVFEAVVRACMDAGLVKGGGFAVDASVMEADASQYHGVTPEEANWSV